MYVIAPSWACLAVAFRRELFDAMICIALTRNFEKWMCFSNTETRAWTRRCILPALRQCTPLFSVLQKCGQDHQMCFGDADRNSIRVLLISTMVANYISWFSHVLFQECVQAPYMENMIIHVHVCMDAGCRARHFKWMFHIWHELQIFCFTMNTLSFHKL